MPDSVSTPKTMKPKTMAEPTSGWARISSTGTAASASEKTMSCVVGSVAALAFLR